MDRISREDFYISMAKLVSFRSTCIKKQVGAILVKDGRVVAMGYNGVLPGVPREAGIDPETGETKTVHAETNLIAFCAKEGIATKGCTMYITLSPCVKCAEIITQAGIEMVYYVEQYRDTEGLEVLKKQGIISLKIDN